MNTPEPCDTCGNLYVNSLGKNDPNYQAECMHKKGRFGDPDCPHYKHYRSHSWGNLPQEVLNI